jgi:hypothetical protein
MGQRASDTRMITFEDVRIPAKVGQLLFTQNRRISRRFVRAYSLYPRMTYNIKWNPSCFRFNKTYINLTQNVCNLKVILEPSIIIKK